MRYIIRKMNSIKKVYKKYGFTNTFKYALNVIFHTQFPIFASQRIRKRIRNIGEVSLVWYRNFQEIPNFPINAQEGKVNLVLDTMFKEKANNNIENSIIIATEFARREQRVLRIITREDRVYPKYYRETLKKYNVALYNNVIFYSDFDRDITGKKKYKIDISENDLFIATSLKTAVAVKKTSIRKNFFFILQDIEPACFSYGEDYYEGLNIYHDPNVQYIINNKQLYNYLTENNLDLGSRCIYTELRCESEIGNRQQESDKRKTLFLYADEKRESTIYHKALYYIDLAIQNGIIDMNQWKVITLKENKKKYDFSNGTNLMKIEKFRMWQFLKEIDLLVTFQPVPCLDSVVQESLRQNKAVVMNKGIFDGVSNSNLFCVKMQDNDVLEGMQQAIQKAEDSADTQKNITRDGYSYKDSIEKLISFMEEKIDV